MEACGVKHNAQTLAPIISRHVDENNLEMAVRQLFSASMQDLVPDHQTMQPVIILAARNNFARLALDLVDWFEGMSNRRLGESVWVNCLIAAAETAYVSLLTLLCRHVQHHPRQVEGVERCWEVVTKRFRTLLDEGVCFAVLNTAARGGLPSLATEALHMLQTINISPQEHHFAAIIEAFCRKGQVKEAILVLDLMSSSGVPSSMETTEPILEYIQKDVKEIDAAWKHVEELHKEGHRLDISLPQSIIIAAIAYGDLSRALAFYSALPELEHSPNLDMYNYLLQGCVQVADRLLGDSLLADMKTTKVKPNPVTYETVIRLCLTQSIYEDAFFYLEEMKAAGHKPSLPIYTALVEKCLDSNDTRHEIALQEMQECGYAVPPSLELRLATNTPLHLSDAERRFIERGGLV
jgi:pentatricopeptide repeat protein